MNTGYKCEQCACKRVYARMTKMVDTLYLEIKCYNCGTQEIHELNSLLLNFRVDKNG